MHLPEGDGLALCRELRDHQLVSPSTPVLLTMPKSPTRRERLEALRAGAWDCLGNPLDAEELLAMLDALIPAKLDADQARTEGLVDETLGLYNALGLARRAQELAAHATRHHAPLACVLFAPDPGPETAEGAPTDGQRLVWERVAGVPKSASRVSDAVGRLGEGVFGVIALDAGAAHARTLAERLAGAMLDPRDRKNENALALSRRLAAEGAALVTTDAVLFEFANYFARSPLRSHCIGWIGAIRCL